MARSRALDAREPGQVREEAALSGSAQAPRVSLTGVQGGLERPGTGFEGGCTVLIQLLCRLERGVKVRAHSWAHITPRQSPPRPPDESSGGNPSLGLLRVIPHGERR